MGNIGFVHGEGKNNLFFSFFSAFAFKQTKEQILHQVQPLKMLNNKKISFILCLQANFSIHKALRPKSDILESGFYNNLAQPGKSPILLSNIIPPYCTSVPCTPGLVFDYCCRWALLCT